VRLGKAPTGTDSPPASDANLLTIQSAALVHTDARGITGGRDMLVWIVKLGGVTERGKATATSRVSIWAAGSRFSLARTCAALLLQTDWPRMTLLESDAAGPALAKRRTAS
jgi:hypothetical protein